MKPFRFSLQPIRVLREQKEQKAQQAFSQAMRLYDEAAFQLQTASDELLAGWNAFRQETTSGTDAMHLTRTRAWCHVLELRQKERAEAVQRAKRAMEASMREMLLATRDREAIDNYRDKRKAAYEYEVQREEQKTLDELGIRRLAPNAGSRRTGIL